MYTQTLSLSHPPHTEINLKVENESSSSREKRTQGKSFPFLGRIFSLSTVKQIFLSLLQTKMRPVFVRFSTFVVAKLDGDALSLLFAVSFAQIIIFATFLLLWISFS